MSARVCIVTGGGQGIGRAISHALGAAGACVIIADVDEEAGEEACADIRDKGGTCHFVRTDVSDENSVQSLMDEVRSGYGGLDVLVNNAGLSEFGPLLADDAVARWDRVLGVNLRGAFLCARYAAPVMLEGGGGVIVNIASTRAFMSEPDGEAYAASKGGMIGLTHALAVSLGPHIRVNAISPGWIDVSDWQKRSVRDAANLRPEDHRQHPAGRVGRPEDIAAACIYLASDGAAFMTGQNLVLDGGMTIKMIYED